ncbi:hypothetical protein BV25DRAFT_1783310, partial [Artomyces pyxidatus]
SNIALVRAGLLGCTPVLPNLAFSIELLEFYHRLRRRHPTIGIQGFVKVICAVHGTMYYAALQDKFSRTFDVYLDILERLQSRTDAALGRDGGAWRIAHGCPCCGFKVRHEPEIVPARLHAMDGCSSQKRLRGVGHTDQREFSSKYFIPPEQVNQFANEVKSRRKQATSPDEQEVDDEGLPISNEKTKCTNSWRTENASAVGKGVAEVFDQTGVFLAACRHGVVEYVEEMVRSGELAKYAFGVIDALLNVCGDDQAIGYDIGCSMDGTVKSSSLRGVAESKRLILLVNAFHGYAHNRLCQLQYHPLYMHGLGIEDLETCERIFSSLNGVSRLIRHASYFHWKQFIHLHLLQWDEDRYGELSTFLYKNYRQSLAMISQYEREVALFQEMTGFTGADFERWRAEELAYLEKAVGKESEEDAQVIAYVEITSNSLGFVNFTPRNFSANYHTPLVIPARAAAEELERKTAQRKLGFALQVSDDLERRLGINERWTPETPEYARVHKYVQRRTFYQAVDELEGLVVQRLFELSKANISGTAYKLRKHISQAITRRSQAVRASLDRYNALAPLQDPPRPTLQYSEIANYSWLGDFELLKESRHEILEQPWSQPANREAAAKYFKIIRAREEIVRLNVEVPRLQAWIDFEDRELKEKAEALASTEPHLAAHIHALRARRAGVNNSHRRRLQQIYRLPGYTG